MPLNDFRRIQTSTLLETLTPNEDFFQELRPRHADESENPALFLWLGLASTLIRHENGTFRKRSSNRRNLKTPTSRFSVNGQHVGNGVFRKR